MNEIETLYKFTFPDGYVTYSRHKKPDFAYHLTDEQIIDHFKREEITDPDEIAKHVWGKPIKKQYIDQYGIDSLPALKDASLRAKESEDEVVFVTSNELVLEDKEILEQHFGLKIMTTEQMLGRMKEENDGKP